MPNETSIATRIRLILARQPRSEEDYERTVDDIDVIIRELEGVQIQLNRERYRRRAN
jgi:hypothetical protein